MNSVNWPGLVEKGRAKAIGVPWSEAELKALAEGIPAEHVREGILTAKDSEKAAAKEDKQKAKTGETPISRMNKTELRKKATELGLEFTPEADTSALREIINAKLEEEAADGSDDSDSDK